MSRSVLVTGGAGFVGANLVRLLLEAGYKVSILDNFSSGDRRYLEGLPIDIFEGDIRDRQIVSQVVPGHWGVVHLAAQAGVPASVEDPFLDHDINVGGTLNMLEASRLSGLERFIFASSNAPLGRQPPPATEDKAPLPISPYGASKLAGEGYCLAYNGTWGLGTVVLRFANLYGPYSAHKNSVVAKFFKDILESGVITIDGDGEQTRDFIYCVDMCRAIVSFLDRDIGGEIYQIATGIETSIIDLAEIVQDITGAKFEIDYGPSRLGDIRKNFSGISKITLELGWRPVVDLKTGILQTWDWYQNL